MISGKFWRLPSRGALGNGLRIIVGCIVATGGTIEVTSRNRRVLLRPLKSGRTEIAAVAEAKHPTGTRIVVTFGPDLPEDPEDLSWARNAISLSRVAGATYARGASPHWLDLDQLVETLAIIEPAETTARQFIERLDGCSGAKAGRIAAPFGKNRTCGSMTEADAAALLAAARAGARPVKPEALGPIGAAAFNPADYGYARQCGSFVHGAHAPQATIPFIVESWVSVVNRKGSDVGVTVLANRTPIVEDVAGYRTPDRKSLRLSGAGLKSWSEIELARGDCSIVLHVTSPLIPISSIGKRPDLSPFQAAIGAAIRQAFARSRNRLPPDPEDPKPEPPPKPAKPPSHKSIVLDRLAEAIAATSENGRYIFSQRNLFYRIRPYVERATGGEELTWGNFTRIITDYEAEHGEIPGLIRDDRGSFHDLLELIGLGTTAVANYTRPAWRFHKILFCEKEDHVRILQQAGWPQRHDCAVMSSKGYATRAARDLIDMVADTADREPVMVFCIHDADASGTMIAQTLQEATRARGRRRIEIVDIGLQPWDAIAMGLPIEDVTYDKVQPVAGYVLDRRDRMNWRNWLQHHRIELNAMTPGQLIRWLDDNVEKHGAIKLAPPSDVIAIALRERIEWTIEEQERERLLKNAEQAIRKKAEAHLRAIAPRLPGQTELADDVRRQLTEDRQQHWTDVIERMAHELGGEDT